METTPRITITVNEETLENFPPYVRHETLEGIRAHVKDNVPECDVVAQAKPLTASHTVTVYDPDDLLPFGVEEDLFAYVESYLDKLSA